MLKKIGVLAISAMMVVSLAACGSSNETTSGNKALTGEVRIDGSSTVFPITEAITEGFLAENQGVQIPVGVSGTGGGFKKFIGNTIDINDASRKIKDKEAEEAKAAGIDYLELQIAYDGLSVIVNPANDFVDSLTVDELKKIWEPNSTVKTWKDVRAEWPAEAIKFYAPGTDSGTFDYFTETINGESGAIRQDFTASEDDNILVQGIAGDKNAIGFFGFAYYEENKDKLKLVKVDNGNGPVEATFDTIKDGSYAPLSRSLYIYVNKASLAKPEVKAYVDYFMASVKEMSAAVGYIPLTDEIYESEKAKLK